LTDFYVIVFPWLHLILIVQGSTKSRLFEEPGMVKVMKGAGVIYWTGEMSVMRVE
jgi:hypothetical protein